MNVKKLLYQTGKKLRLSAPTIFTVVSAGGVVATTVLAVRATPKALDTIKQDSRIAHNGDPYSYTNYEAFKSAWKCYIPTAAVGLSTIGLIIGSNVLNKQQQANMASLYALLDQSFRRYRKAADEVFGDGADYKIKAQVAKDMYINSPGMFGSGCIYDPELDDNSDKVLFFDWFSNRYFESTFAAVTNAQYHLNRNWVLRGEVTVNEFYEFLGIDTIPELELIGWPCEYVEEGICWLDFDVYKANIDENMDCFVIAPSVDPIPLNMTIEEAGEYDYRYK